MPVTRPAAALTLCLAIAAIAAPGAWAEPAQPVQVLMIVNEGFFAPEYYEPRAIFERAGFEVTVAAKTTQLIAPDARNVGAAPVKPDLSFEQVDVSRFDAVTFAGGNGAWTDYFPNDRVHQIVADALNQGKVTGLICASTGLLGVAKNYDGHSAPIAKGRHVTGYFRVEGLLRNLGQVKYDAGVAGKPHVVVDGNLITGRDPQSSRLFGETVAKRLAKKAP